ncbi:MAG: endopeptidase La [Treponema sp.]|jgi:ATP-dependent Lon protease|nr:endopeptidase La [Treponema sp.]
MLDPVVPFDQTLPNTLLILNLVKHPIFPGIFMPLLIIKHADVQMLEHVIAEEGFVGLVMLAHESETPEFSDFCKVGTVAKIVKKINLPDGGINIFISTIKRFKIKKVINERKPVIVTVQYLEEINDETPEVKALTRALLSEMKIIIENNPLFSEEMRLNMVNIDQPGRIADFIVSILNIDSREQQKVLEQLNVRKRMEQVLVFIKKEQELFILQKRITNEINSKIDKSQREYFLKEELKAIKMELGMATDPAASDYQRFKDKFDSFHFEGEIKELVEQELEKFSIMEPQSPEYMVTRNYLDVIASLPWLEPAAENIDLAYAQKTLENDHYGLQDVKSRIIEYLAVRKLRNSQTHGARRTNGANTRDRKTSAASNSIICLVGPPGVGKTSVGKSIARALNKEFFRFSVGGMRDEAEIKGHRRTYIGAMPGKILQGIKITKTKDPVFMIDEIDKMGVSYQGDPASALLEVLDPEQNVNFRDHYLDLPFDISGVFFIVTANTLDTIPHPLLDRMEIIDLPGYINIEKLEIAKRYLVPKSLEKNGLEKGQAKYAKESLLYIANCYAREAGVRNFEKNLDKIHRKLAKEIVEADDQREKRGEEAEKGKRGKRAAADTKKTNKATRKPVFIVDKAVIEKHLGKPLFPEDDIKKANKPGMSIGLAWTSMGGDTLVIEAVSMAGKEGFTLTGNMGDTMKESAAIAMTVAQKIGVERYGVDASWFTKNHIHLHIPAGATPKDGPSAGVTMAVALCSLFSNRVITHKLVMTGELSLTGRVLPIGGLKEKTIAAARNKARYIIIPKQNLRDLDDIPAIVKKGLTFYPVEFFEEALALALPD